MNELDEAYAAEVDPDEKREFDRVPDGKYRVAVKDAVIEPTKADPTKDRFTWTLEITGPTSEGRLLWKHNGLSTAENIKYLKKDLAVCGVTIKSREDLKKATMQVQGLNLEINLKSKGEYQNVYLNKLIEGEEEKEEKLPF